VRAALLPAAVIVALVATTVAGRAVEPTAVRVQASREGFSPERLTLRRGETVRVHLTSADGPHCFAVDGLRVEKRIVPGRETVFDVSPDEGGSFPFYCCLETGAALDRERGEIVVTE